MGKFNNSKKVCAVIQFQKRGNVPTLPLEQLSALGRFAFIVHDNDIKEDGTKKGLHGHLVVEAIKGASSDTWIKRLALLFGVENDAVSIECAKNMVGCVRYLTHEDNSDKTHYEKTAIKTNSREWLEKNSDYPKALTTKELMGIESEDELIERVSNPSMYRAIFNAWEHLQAYKRKKAIEEGEVRLSEDRLTIIEAQKRLQRIIQCHTAEGGLRQDLQDLYFLLCVGMSKKDE